MKTSSLTCNYLEHHPLQNFIKLASLTLFCSKLLLVGNTVYLLAMILSKYIVLSQCNKYISLLGILENLFSSQSFFEIAFGGIRKTSEGMCIFKDNQTRYLKVEILLAEIFDNQAEMFNKSIKSQILYNGKFSAQLRFNRWTMYGRT